MEFVEVTGKSVEIAIQAGVAELGATSVDELDVEVIQQPEKGFLGLGGRDAIVRLTRRPAESGRGRNRRRKRGRNGGSSSQQGAEARNSGSQTSRNPQTSGAPGESTRGGQGKRSDGRNGRGQGSGRGPRAGSGEKISPTGSTGSTDRPAPGDPTRGSEQRSQRGARQGNERQGNERSRDRAREESDRTREEPNVPIEEQVPVVESFLTGLVRAFGLDGAVTVTVDDDVIVAEITGEQTESMVGNRGSVIEAIHELTKTVMHRKMQTAARLRLDIAGYGERRRRALGIYAAQLVEQVLTEGGEIMLEPMSASDRKVIHDAVADREGVRSYSEGEAPQRFVVIQSTNPAGTNPAATNPVGADDAGPDDAGADDAGADDAGPDDEEE